MSTTMTWTANPSRFALPMYGPDFGMRACIQGDSLIGVGVMDTIAVRDHVATAATGRTKGAFPGNPAWRPPIC
jgi:hypothetical protein